MYGIIDNKLNFSEIYYNYIKIIWKYNSLIVFYYFLVF